MLTIFSTPKPFEGRIAVIQRNAIQSWLLLSPDVEVMLIGDDPGTSETAREFGIRHVKHIERNETGAKYLSSIFTQAQNLARYPIVAYINCDIMLMSDFLRAVEQVSAWRNRFLMAGRRWEIDILEPWEFQASNWEAGLRNRVLARGKRRSQHAIDYFVFPRGMYPDIPPLVIGRFWWDHWLIWRARSTPIPMVDATATVMAVHQNHDYAYHPQGLHGVWYGREAKANRELAGKGRHLATLDEATHLLTNRGIKPNRFSRLAPWRRRLVLFANAAWYTGLEISKPLRYALGLTRRRV
jgi:hypothetical protein